MEFIVTECNNERIDYYLSKIKELDLSRSKIQKLIETNDILVNGNVIKNNYKVNKNDKIGIVSDKSTTISALFNIIAGEDNKNKKNVDLVIIEGVESTGLGLAIMNRLIRACSHNYIEI